MSVGRPPSNLMDLIDPAHCSAPLLRPESKMLAEVHASPSADRQPSAIAAGAAPVKGVTFAGIGEHLTNGASNAGGGSGDLNGDRVGIDSASPMDADTGSLSRRIFETPPSSVVPPALNKQGVMEHGRGEIVPRAVDNSTASNHAEVGCPSSALEGEVGDISPEAVSGAFEGAPSQAAIPSAPAACRPPPKKKARKARTPRPKKPAPTNVVRKRRKIKSPRPPEVPLGSGGRERAMKILQALVDNPLSDEFHKPVTQMHPELAGRYDSVVRRPIDLTTVARRLRRGTYDNASDRLRRDMIRIFRNCERFNKDSSQLFVGIARYLQALFEALWSEARLPIAGKTPSEVARRMSMLRMFRYRLCWGAPLQGPLLGSAREALAEAGRAAAKEGGARGARLEQRIKTELEPLLEP
ncbi:unnamed protein product, partial [Discosporangium mesarthrocarpum]